MSLVLRVGHGVETPPERDDDWLPPGVSDTTKRALAEWSALAPSTDSAARPVLRAQAERLAETVARQSGTVVQVVSDDGVVEFGDTEPVPWGPGLVLAGIAAVFVVTAALALDAALRQVNVLVSVVVLALTQLLLLPTAAHYRTRPTWRWVVLGGVAGAALAWVWLLLTAIT